MVLTYVSTNVLLFLTLDIIHTCSSLDSRDGVLYSESISLDFIHRRLVTKTRFCSGLCSCRQVWEGNLTGRSLRASYSL